MNQQNHKTCGKLIICVVREGHGDRVVAITRENGAKGGTIVPGRGKSDNPLVDFLCIGDHREEVVLTLVNGEEVASVINALKAHGRDTQKGSRGMGILLNVPRIIHHAGKGSAACEAVGRREAVKKDEGRVMICVIVNWGCADDLMTIARKAGAVGGTILKARGTASEEDVKFLGIPLFPEKEILLVVTERSRSSAILEALEKSDCLLRPGGGIAFSVDVEELINLGGDIA
jgi:hypothetical protein